MFYRRIAALVFVGLFSLTAASCANGFGQKLGNVFSAATTASVDPQAIIVAANTFDGLQATAKAYLRLPRCTGANGPVCRSPAATPPLINAVQSGRRARNAALAFLKSHPGQLGPQGVYDALQSSVGLIQSIFATYNIGGV